MSLFSEIEKSIERGFRHWTERVFGPAQSGELLMMHHAILEKVEGQVKTLARGQRFFPFALVTITFRAEDEARRGVVQAAFGEAERLERDIRELLQSAGCALPDGFAVEIRTSETATAPFEIHYGAAPSRPAQEPAPARLVVLKGKAHRDEYLLDRSRTNIGRLAELTDSEDRVVCRNDVVFEEGADPVNASVSRKHAHIREEAGEYRICDDASEYGTRVFRDGRAIEVPRGNRRGEKLRSGDEIYLGRACLRFEQS